MLSLLQRALLLGTALVVPAAAFAEVEEITVTARKRSETLQSVPVAVSAFTAKTIEDAGIRNPGDFLQLTPGVTYVQSQNAGTSFITIRGIGQVRNGESPVAVIIDGVVQSSTNAFNQRLVDVERIEVLKGPQGALYGRNAEGGAINIVTKQPTDEFEARLGGGIGNGGARTVLGSVSGPIVPGKLQFRVAGSDFEQNGLIENTFLRQKADFYDERSGHGLLTWTPTDNLKVDLRAGALQSHGAAVNFVVNSQLYIGGPDFVGDANNASVPIQTNVRPFNDRNTREASAKIDYETPYGRLTAITGYDRLHETLGSAVAPYAYNRAFPQTTTQDLRVRNTSQEVRFTSPDNERLRYIVGAYYLHTKRSLETTTGTDKGRGVVLLGIQGPASDNPTVTVLSDSNRNNAYAVFAQADYDILPNLELSAAFRYDRDERKQTDVAPPAFSTTSGKVRSAAFSSPQPKLTLRYKANDDITLYGIYSQGFRSGGFNQNGVAIVARNAVPPNPFVRDDFGKETSKNFEIGAKTRWFQHRLTVNASLYDTQVRGQQYYSFLAAASAQIITNIDKVHIRGAELEAIAPVTANWDLFGAYTWTEAIIKANQLDRTTLGNWAPYVARNKVNLGAQLHAPVATELAAVARVDYERRGRQFWDPNNTTARKPLNFVNARVALERENGAWSIALWSKNLTNVKYNSEFVAGGFAFRGDPRTFGIDVDVKF